jgi:hypothetical protein
MRQKRVEERKGGIVTKYYYVTIAIGRARKESLKRQLSNIESTKHS